MKLSFCVVDRQATSWHLYSVKHRLLKKETQSSSCCLISDLSALYVTPPFVHIAHLQRYFQFCLQRYFRDLTDVCSLAGVIKCSPEGGTQHSNPTFPQCAAALLFFLAGCTVHLGIFSSLPQPMAGRGSGWRGLWKCCELNVDFYFIYLFIFSPLETFYPSQQRADTLETSEKMPLKIQPASG